MTTSEQFFSIREIDGSGKTFEIDDSERIVGRGIFLGVTDKRISRNHGVLRATAKGIELKSIHINPCFYTKKNSPKTWVKLDKNDTVLLENGDTFSLLPKSHIYKIVGPENNGESTTNGAKITEKTPIIDTPENVIISGCTVGPSHISQGDKTASSNDVKPEGPDEMGDKNKEPKLIFGSSLPSEEDPISQKEIITQANSHKEENTRNKPKNLKTNTEDSGEIATPTNRKRKLPAWMLDTTAKKDLQKTPKKQYEKASNPTSTKETQKNTPNTKQKKHILIFTDSSDDEGDDSGARKDVRSSQGPGKKENKNPDKTEVYKNPDEVVEVIDQSMMTDTNKRNDQDDKNLHARESLHPTDDDVDGASSSVVGSSDEQSSVDPNCATSNISKTRQTCGFGSSCYRKNPIHFQNFSHPGDPDYIIAASDSDDDKPECPHGTNCFRRNPLHKKQFRHTKRVAPKRQVKRRDKESSEDDYDYDDSFLNDDSDDDVDAGVSEEEDSDWEPSEKSSQRSKRLRTKYTPDSELTDDDEDVSKLVSDAKKFARNKKMWK